MTERTASPHVLSPRTMLPPLVVFFAACFLFAGVVKFRLRGGELWLARPAGALVTCLFLGLVGLVAGRWFFGTRPNAIGRRVLGWLVVLIPLMGLLGAFQLVTRDADTAAADPTPLGGSLGRLLAGPKAFGMLGTTVAGILFATLAGVGALLARRMNADDRARAGEDPYAVMKVMSGRRAPATTGTAAAATAVLEEPAEAQEAGSLFPVDAELEPETATVSAPAPLGGIEVVEEVERVEEVVEPPKRMPVLSGIVEEDMEEPTEEMPAQIFRPAMLLEPETDEDEAMVLDLAEPAAEVAIDIQPEIDVEPTIADAATPSPEPEVERPPRVTTPPPPSIETEDEPSLESDDDEDPMTDDPELGEYHGGETPELALEWLAAPGAFHVPRLLDTIVTTNEAMEEILDVGAGAKAESAPEPAPEPAPVADAEPVAAPEAAGLLFEMAPETAAPEAPLAEPKRERPRFRVKAVVAEDAPSVEVTRLDDQIEIPFQIAEEAPDQTAGFSRHVLQESDEGVPTADPAPTTDVAPPPPIEVETPAAADTQLELPSMPATPAETADEDDAARPKRRMRSARKDWASWDEQPSKERPRLRLLKPEEPAEAQQVPPADETEQQVEIPVARDEAPAPLRKPARREVVRDADDDHDEAPAADPYDRAVALVVQEDRCSVSLLQRHLGVTFGEATALIDRMYQQGVVGPYQPTGRRDVLLGKKGASAAEEA